MSDPQPPDAIRPELQGRLGTPHTRANAEHRINAALSKIGTIRHDLASLAILIENIASHPNIDTVVEAVDLIPPMLTVVEEMLGVVDVAALFEDEDGDDDDLAE